MLTFFRRIRKRLLEGGSTSKYLVYAIGEIALVVIGILIALQINNWNEWKKERILEKKYLNEIKTDLKKDKGFLHSIYPDFEERLAQYIFIDSIYFLEPHQVKPLRDSNFHFTDLFNSPRPYSPTIGTYQALISDGKSSLIQNRDLFAKLQTLYEIEISTILSIGTTMNNRKEKSKWDNRILLRESPFASPIDIKDIKILSELRLINESMSLYYKFLKRYEQQIEQIIELIDNELSK